MYRLTGIEYIEPNIKRETYVDFPEEESMPETITDNPAYKPNYKMKVNLITEKAHIKMGKLEPGDWFTADGLQDPMLMKVDPAGCAYTCVDLQGHLYIVSDQRVVCPLKSTVPHCMQHVNAC